MIAHPSCQSYSVHEPRPPDQAETCFGTTATCHVVSISDDIFDLPTLIELSLTQHFGYSRPKPASRDPLAVADRLHPAGTPRPATCIFPRQCGMSPAMVVWEGLHDVRCLDPPPSSSKEESTKPSRTRKAYAALQPKAGTCLRHLLRAACATDPSGMVAWHSFFVYRLVTVVMLRESIAIVMGI